MFGFRLGKLGAALKKAGFNVRSLFSSGEQGAWYDPSDINLTWRRNLLTYSEQFDNAAWTKTNATITTNAVDAPDGTLTADKLVVGTSAGSLSRYATKGASVSAGVNTISVYAKQAELTYLVIGCAGASGTPPAFNLITGAIGGAPTKGTASIASVGNGWYRCSWSVTTTTDGSVYIFVSDSASQTTTVNDGTSGIYIWGAQLEAGTTATAYQKITDGVQDYYTYQAQPVLFQDSAGTTPVTAVEQPVGLMLDKSRGLVLGAELVTNGDFSNPVTTGWTVDGAVTISVVSATLEVASIGSTAVQVSYPISVVAGKSYWISATVSSGLFASATLSVRDGSTAASTSLFAVFSLTGTASGTSGKALYTALSTGTVYIAIRQATASTTRYWDNISVRELPGNHAYQTTSASRPVLSARVNLLTKTEQFDDAVWSKGNVNVTANSIAAPDGTTTADIAEIVINPNGHSLFQSATVVPGASYTFKFYVKRGTATNLKYSVYDATGAANIIAPTSYYGITTSSTWSLITISFTAPAGCTTARVYTLRDSEALGTVYIWGASLVPADQASLPYQRVNTSTDYDTVGFPTYLKFDGVDDGMVTNSIDFATATSDGLARRNLLTYPTAFDDAAWVVTTGSKTVSSNSSIAPDGTLTADTITLSSQALVQYFNAGVTAYTASIWLKGSGTITFCLMTNGYGRIDQQVVTLTSEWTRYLSSGSLSAGNTIVGVMLVGTATFDVWGAQLEVGAAATAFQNIGTDKMHVCAGVRKLSDAATGILAELGTGTESGRWLSAAPGSSGANSFTFSSTGTSSSTAGVGVFASAPATKVLTGIGSISADVATLRINGIEIATSALDQGTGNYGNYPIYIGRRGGTTLPFNGRIGQLVIRGASSTDAQIASAERWVNQKTGAY